MTTRATVPVFAFEDSDITNLQNLSSSVALMATTKVGWRTYKNNDQSLTAGNNAQITFSGNAFLADVSISSGGILIATQGYYECECNLPFSNTSSAGASARAWFTVTTGSNNPTGSGVSIIFGRLSDLTSGDGDEMSFTLFGASPCLYPGDLIEVNANIGGSNVTVSASWNNSGNTDLAGVPDGGAQFTGALVSEGP